MSEEISGLLKQAKSEARLENFFKFIGKNARIMIYIAVAFLLIGLITLVLSIYQENQREKYSGIFHQALIYQQVGEIEKFKGSLEEIVNSSAPSGVKSLASLRYAAVLLNEGDLKGARNIYEEVSECGSCDDYVQNLASLLLVRLMIADENGESDSDQLVVKIIKIEGRSTIFKNHIAEQLAMFELLRDNLKESYEIFTKIAADKSSSPALKARSEDGMKMVLARGFKPVK
jgi:hypothetical protein